MTQRLTWLILALVALALRLPDLGNPLVDLDEQMYLLVGQHMWAGAIPYVDIWDRKPIGLFLLYAASQAIPGDPVVAYQLVALAAATATAGVIALCVRRLGGGARGALGAGILYLVWLELIGGRGGQSPVFYDLPVALAALLAWDTISGRRRAGPVAMLLIGVALQIKPTVVFEGCFLGAALLAASWRRHRRVGPVLRDAAVYGLAALVPTIAAAAVYVAMGHGEAWWFANVRSIFLRRVTADDPIRGRLLGQAIVLFVPVILAMRGVLARRGAERVFVAGWLAAAVVGWLLVPPYFNHYALPLLVPIAVASGLTLERWTQAALAVVVGAVLLGFSGYPHRGETEDNRRRLAALAQVVRAHTGQGCPFVFQAPPAIYTAARACLPGRYPFPPHLVEASERGAIGVDPVTEVRRILAVGPPVIVAGPLTGRGDTVRIVVEAVAHRYRPVARDLGMTIYVRRN